MIKTITCSREHYEEARAWVKAVLPFSTVVVGGTPDDTLKTFVRLAAQSSTLIKNKEGKVVPANDDIVVFLFQEDLWDTDRTAPAEQLLYQRIAAACNLTYSSIGWTPARGAAARTNVTKELIDA